MSAAEFYDALVVMKKMERDPAQQHLLARLVALEGRVATHRAARRSRPVNWLFGSRDQDEPVKGLYIHGDVGRGKTMLMDLFFEATPVVRKRRAHFHEFMADVHDRVRVFRQQLKAARSRATTRSGSPPARSPRRAGCSASTNSTSPTSPMP